MNKRLKAKWVKALRSGEYQQCHRVLFRSKAYFGIEAGYCCLGVLRKIEPRIRSLQPRKELLSPTSCGIPIPAQEKLAHYNDNGWSFKRIADHIEANL